MSFIEIIEPKNASGELAEAYQKVSSDRGKVANVMKLHSLLPDTMNTHLNLYKSIVFKRNLIKREIAEYIAVTVSIENNCKYCINHHLQPLIKFGHDKNEILDNIKNPDLISDNQLKAVIKYSKKLASRPEKVGEEDLNKLKEVGFSDKQLLNIVLIISYFSFVNRNVTALGINFSDDEISGYNY